MSREREDKLVAILAAVGSGLPRRAIYDRVDEEFDNEEDLAKTLGRLVADGRLAREMRPRLGKNPEAIYSTPRGNAARLQVIVAAAHKTVAPNVTAIPVELIEIPAFLPTAPAASPLDKENDMGRRSTAEILALVKDALFGARELPMSLADVATAAGVTSGSAKSALKALAKEDLANSMGKGRGTKWAPGPVLDKAVPAVPRRASSTPAAPPVVLNGGARFGYFNDGTLAIEAENCKGVLASGELSALRDYLSRFEGTR